MLKLLDGIKVLDLTRLLPGPQCTLYLAQLGAQVIKIEPPEGDYVRHIPPLLGKDSYLFHQLNFNKSIQSIDLKQEEGLKAFLALAKQANVVVESFRPGVTSSLGIDFESLKHINPSLVYCSITGYGQSGPYQDEPGHDINYLAYSGILDQMGSLPNFQIADIAGGSLTAALAIVSALVDSQKHQRAHYLDISMLDCVTTLNQVALATYQARQKDIPAGKDILSGGSPFYGVYETADGRQLALGCLEAKFWKNFCHVIGKDQWVNWHAESPAQYPTFRQEIAKLIKSKNLQEWSELLAKKESCVTPVLRLSEVLQDPQLKMRNIIEKRQTSSGESFLSFNLPIRLGS